MHPDVHAAFENRWVESKSLMRQVRNRRLMVDALRVLLPPVKAAAPMQLYRGTSSRERPSRCGLSWTTDIEIARVFAHRLGDHRIVLTTAADPEAILLVREEGYRDEGEVIVDPFRLGKVKISERNRSPAVRSAV